jgi:hypothetical protein
MKAISLLSNACHAKTTTRFTTDSSGSYLENQNAGRKCFAVLPKLLFIFFLLIAIKADASDPVLNQTTITTYATLQAAIDAAASGETLVLTADITEGLITVNKNIIITSNSPFKKITSTSSSYGVHITSPCQFFNIIIEGDGIAGAGKFGLITDCAADGITVNSVRVQNFGATGFAISGCDNSYFYNLTATNNKGNGISITNCINTLFQDITTSGNAFVGGFSAGIGIFTSNAFCPTSGPGVTNNITITGAINISESVKVYDQPASGSPIGTVTFNPTSGSVSAFTHFMGIGTTRFFASSLADAKVYANTTITSNSSVYTPSVHIQEISTGNKYVYAASPAMSVQAALNNAEEGKTLIIEDGSYPEANISITKNILFQLTSDNTVTLSAATVAANKELTHNKSFNITTLTNNGNYSGKGWNGKLINNGTVSPK